jgi:hypothetical protein
MSTINNIESNRFVSLQVGSKKTQETGDLAGLSLLAKSLSEIAARPQFQSVSDAGPSDGQLQRAYGALIELLAKLQGTLAKYSHQNAQSNGAVGTALMDEMTAVCKNQLEELKKISEQEANSSWWSSFSKWMQGILGGLSFIASLIGGQPQLAAIVLTLTILSLSGGTQKITESIANLISKDLTARYPNMSKEDADKIAKIIADIIVVVVVIVVTAVSAGAGSASALENNASEAAAQAGQGVDASFLTKLLDFVKEYNPFGKLPVRVNNSLIGASQALASTNFSTDMMAAACMHMKDDKDKEILQTTLGIVLSLLIAIAGAGASAASSLEPQVESAFNSFLKGIKEFKLSAALKALMGAELLSGTLESSGQAALGATNIQLGQTLNEKGQTQALLTMLQALLSMNAEQLTNIAKDTSAEQRALAASIAALSNTLNKMQEEAARQTQV